jgi:hypothetical protein
MMTRVLWVGLAPIVAFGAGWARGVWGQSDISLAFTRIDEGQPMAGPLNQHANALAADAAQAIDNVLARLPAAPPG